MVTLWLVMGRGVLEPPPPPPQAASSADATRATAVNRIFMDPPLFCLLRSGNAPLPRSHCSKPLEECPDPPTLCVVYITFFFRSARSTRTDAPGPALRSR